MTSCDRCCRGAVRRGEEAGLTALPGACTDGSGARRVHGGRTGAGVWAGDTAQSLEELAMKRMKMSNFFLWLACSSPSDCHGAFLFAI